MCGLGDHNDGIIAFDLKGNLIHFNREAKKLLNRQYLDDIRFDRFFKEFDQIMALTKGGPAQSTESISYLIYNNGMSGGQFGFQSANAVIFFIVIVVISVMQLTITGKKEEQL